eukprot:gnl/TRDRNA2_/TRDRNA2_59236_c0_seq1.p1 gnl/TRDRNA2_/TRDRNA2_59236_c0~~gnl/TRDRNA2_/TRDRNA2_59236_c0_seq1.p1  ORF type:complete len:329 (-),score=69.70 gnl/TRDRNA2_/TRDRNA2_59236_c0_seq1:284-1216(-)
MADVRWARSLSPPSCRLAALIFLAAFAYVAGRDTARKSLRETLQLIKSNHIGVKFFHGDVYHVASDLDPEAMAGRLKGITPDYEIVPDSEQMGCCLMQKVDLIRNHGAFRTKEELNDLLIDLASCCLMTPDLCVQPAEKAYSILVQVAMNMNKPPPDLDEGELEEVQLNLAAKAAGILLNAVRAHTDEERMKPHFREMISLCFYDANSPEKCTWEKLTKLSEKIDTESGFRERGKHKKVKLTKKQKKKIKQQKKEMAKAALQDEDERERKHWEGVEARYAAIQKAMPYEATEAAVRERNEKKMKRFQGEL